MSSRIINSPILVAGAGSWGTALAALLANNGQRVYLWGHDPIHLADLRGQRQNVKYLPGVELPENITLIDDLANGVEHTDDALIVVPCKAMRPVLTAITRARAVKRIAWACKGVETKTHKLMHDVVGEVCGDAVAMAVISGPNFAKEVAVGLPTAITVAANDDGFADDLVSRLHNEKFRPYTSTDIVGVEVGGAVKNVLAIAAGVSDGLGFGANTRAALITRGLAEMTRLGCALGGQRETFFGLTGLGDLVLSCTDDKSRNRRLGLAMAKGKSPEQAMIEIGQVVEGASTAYEIQCLANRCQVEMPIATEVVRLLKQACSPGEAVKALLARETKQEMA